MGDLAMKLKVFFVRFEIKSLLMYIYIYFFSETSFFTVELFFLGGNAFVIPKWIEIRRLLNQSK